MTTPTTLKTSRDLVQKAETAYQNGDDITCARFYGRSHNYRIPGAGRTDGLPPQRPKGNPAICQNPG